MVKGTKGLDVGPNDLDFARRVRRAIHQHPEPSHAEVRTAAYVERLLSRMGLTPFRPAPNSVAVVVGSGAGRPRVGIRADLDALPIAEATGRPYASRIPGLAHACGHDGHTALVLALARRLARRPPPDRRILLVWQQGEEASPSGAPLVLAGLTDLLRPDWMFAFHLWPELPIGTVGVRPGPVLASVAGLRLTIHGRPGRQHGVACDDAGVDALRASVRIFDDIAGRWSSRHPTAAEPAVVTIGRLSGGEAPNRVPLRCEIEGTLRAISRTEESRALDTIRALAEQVARDTGARIDLDHRADIRPSVSNDLEAVSMVRDAARRRGVTCLEYPTGPVGVSEDFGWFIEDRPGALIFLGCASDDTAPDLHTPGFDFDETALLAGVDVAEDLARGGGAVGGAGHDQNVEEQR